jgi:prepilin-type N-terminal cleavage/methylation domain-containing protein
MTLTRSRGFSLMELLITMAIGLTIAGIAAMAYVPVMSQQHVTNAYNTTLTALRRAHDQAAGDMRIYVVSFTAPGTISVNQNSTTGPLLFTSVLPSDVTFHIEPGVPTSATVAPTTPDGFGTAAYPIDFDQGVPPGGSTVVQFNPDGTATDINGNINNGVVYLGKVGNLYSCRAVTLWGATGRLRGWRLYKSGANYAWSQQ